MRSVGPYSLITWPLGGKSDLEVSASERWRCGHEAYGAAHASEMLTIKSDDVGRSKAYEAIVKGTPMPKARHP